MYLKSVVFYVSWYNLKCKSLLELTALKDSSIQADSTLTSRITKLDKISADCSESMNKIENALPRSGRRVYI